MKSLFFKADSLKHKSQIINSMQKKDHKQLWLGLNNGNTIIIALSVQHLCILRERGLLGLNGFKYDYKFNRCNALLVFFI